MNVLEVNGLGKAYKLYTHRKSRLIEWLDPRNKSYHSLTWILKDINFSIKAGEALGIIGVNGAGKSTLLKIITGTTQPTKGNVKVNGKVAALLELGMGFHPEFTGRQNVLMAGQLMGCTAEEIKNLLPAIEEFAEIGEYIDQPVRVYSSGMQVRLAFSLATASRPDILIVDEALSVGDAYFQHKCFEKIQSLKKSGVTLLFVSHDKQAVLSMCDKALLLNGGEIALEGKPEQVMDYYNAMLADNEKKTIKIKKQNDKTQTISGGGEAEILDIQLFNCKGEVVTQAYVGDDVKLQVQVRVKEKIPCLILGYAIKNRLGQVIFGTNTWHTGQAINNPKINQTYTYNICFKANFGVDHYSLSLALHGQETHISSNYEWRDLAYMFSIINIDKALFEGCNWTEPVITYE